MATYFTPAVANSDSSAANDEMLQVLLYAHVLKFLCCLLPALQL